jgi:predicted MFS family arabinose efflux permease
VFLDLFGVALVVPNLIFRWKEVGITPAGLGLVGSIYSASQLVGGLIIGWLGDRKFTRKQMLLVSFVGAGISYTLVGLATNVATLVLSRVIVGLVKQTMTISTALTTVLSTESSRAQALGRLSSAQTVAFLAGQAAGGALSARYGRRAPCFVASALFVLAFALVVTCLPSDAPRAPAKAAARGAEESGGSSLREQLGRQVHAFTSSFAQGFRSTRARHVLLLRLAYGFLMRSGYSLHSLYEQQRWELTPENAGYLSSYKTALGLAIDSLFIGVLAKRLSERMLLSLALCASVANAALEASHSTFMLYACINLPVSSVVGVLSRTTLSVLFSKAVPTADAGSALSVLDVLNSAIGIAAPIYGGALLGQLGVSMQPLVSVAHYGLLIVLLRSLSIDEPVEEQGGNKGKQA